MHPFINLNSNTEGSVKLCCSITENIHVADGDGELNFGVHSIEDIWYGKYMTDIRMAMLKNEKPEACNVCWKLEDMGIQSSRQSAFGEFAELGIKRDATMHSRPPLPTSLELRLGNFCNLRCNSCWSLSSDRIADERTKILKTDTSLPQWIIDEWSNEIDLANSSNFEWWQDSQFDDTIRKLAPGLKRLYMTGGEPTLIKRNIEIMNMILASGNTDCFIALTTNLTHWSREFFDTCAKFNAGEIQISIDSVYQRNQYIRFPTQWKHIDKNLTNVFQTLPNTWKIKHYTVFQTYNYDDIPEIIDWVLSFLAKQENKDRMYIWSPIILDNPSYLDVRIIDRDVRLEAVERLKHYDWPPESNNFWYAHGVEQCIKLLEAPQMDAESQTKWLSRFREFNDTMDRNRPGPKWYNVFTNIAEKVLNNDYN